MRKKDLHVLMENLHRPLQNISASFAEYADRMQKAIDNLFFRQEKLEARIRKLEKKK